MNPKIIKIWHDKLAALLERARTLPESGEDALALARELEAFTHDHLPDEQLDELDQVARDTHDALVLGDVRKRLAGIAANSAAFEAVTEKLQGQIGINLKAARSISLANVQEVVSSATDAVIAIKELKAAVVAQTGSPDQLQALGAKLDAALAALEKFQGAVKSAE